MHNHVIGMRSAGTLASYLRHLLLHFVGKPGHLASQSILILRYSNIVLIPGFVVSKHESHMVEASYFALGIHASRIVES